MSSNRHAPAQTLSNLAGPTPRTPLTGPRRNAIRHADRPSSLTLVYTLPTPTHPCPTDPRLAPAAQRPQPGPASAGFRSDVKQLPGIGARPRPKRYGALAEIELAPSRADCSSHGNAATVPSCPQGRRSSQARWRARATRLRLHRPSRCDGCFPFRLGSDLVGSRRWLSSFHSGTRPAARPLALASRSRSLRRRDGVRGVGSGWARVDNSGLTRLLGVVSWAGR